MNNQTEVEQFKTAAEAAWEARKAARKALSMALQAALAAVEVDKLPIKQKIRRVRKESSDERV